MQRARSGFSNPGKANSERAVPLPELHGLMDGRETMISEQRTMRNPSFSLSACSTNPSSHHMIKHLRVENGDVPICSTADNCDTRDGDGNGDGQFCYRMHRGEWSSTVVNDDEDVGECSSGLQHGFTGGEAVGTMGPNVDEFNAMIDRLNLISKGRTRRNGKKSKASAGQGGIRILSRRLPVLRIQSRRRRLSNDNDDGGRTKRDGGAMYGYGNDLQSLGLFLGMPIAAVLTQVLDGKSYTGQRIESDHLLRIFSTAVRESLAHVYGNRLDCFVRNFEKSFGSTLKTLRSVNEASSMDGQKIPCSTSNIEDYRTSEVLPCSLQSPRCYSAAEIAQDRMVSDHMSQQIILHGQVGSSQLACVAQRTSGLRFNESMLDTFEKSIMEQTRSNDLKTLEIGLTMQKLQMKQSQLALDSDSNLLKRISISMGISKASFKEEKLKGQLKDTRYAEFLRKCTDCLIFGLVVMSASLSYGTYIYSYDRIKEATASCTPTPKQSTSWWIPNPVSSMSTQLLELRCQLQVLSHMLLGVSMVLAIAYFLLRRADLSQHTMPLTFIILLLGVGCGFTGKLCVETLGGNGYNWLLYWEILCSLHLFANTYTSALFYILNGPISVSQGPEKVGMMLPYWLRICLPYWLRRCMFYSLLLVVLPALCGLMPFASLYTWREHFSDHLWDHFPVSEIDTRERG